VLAIATGRREAIIILPQETTVDQKTRIPVETTPAVAVTVQVAAMVEETQVKSNLVLTKALDIRKGSHAEKHGSLFIFNEMQNQMQNHYRQNEIHAKCTI
jgi:hypothetical protein